MVRKIINRFKDKLKKLIRGRLADPTAPLNNQEHLLTTTDTSAAMAESEASSSRRRRRRKKKSPEGASDSVDLRPLEPAQPAEADPWDESQFVVPKEEGKARFHDLDLPNEIMHAIADLGFGYCTPIQAQALPSTLTGKDAAGKAQTGTGKTAAFLVTILTRLLRTEPHAKRRHGAPRALVLAPTRELVLQIVEDAKLLSKYCNLHLVALVGGMDYEKQQRQVVGQQVDLVVATPGRLLDFKRQQYVHLDQVEILVIDEADRMLDMGFIPDVRQIVYSTPAKEKRQTLLFSATLTPEVLRLAGQWTREPVMIEIEPEQVVTETVEQQVYLVTSKEKFPLLYNIITRLNLERVMIFCNRKDETRFLAEKLDRYDINCAILSGDVSQAARVKTLEGFRAGKIRVLVATDVAGRGIHIEGVTHVINYTLPHDAEDYVHRIGRTGRAGATGTSVSFADEGDSFQIPDIEEFIGDKLHCVHPDPEWLTVPPPLKPAKRKEPGDDHGRSGSGRPPRSGGRRPSSRRRPTSKPSA
ncbi:MAG: ATP-dependent RNA helicase RhlB [Thermodesulfobacteriota bacterium]